MLVCSQPLQQRWLHKRIVSDLRNSVAIENSGGDKETCITNTAVGASSETHGLTAHAEHPIQQTSGLWQCWFGCHTGTWRKDHTYTNTWTLSQVLVISLPGRWLCCTWPPLMRNTRTSSPRQHHCRRELFVFWAQQVNLSLSYHHDRWGQ